VAALVERIKGRYRFHVMARGRFPDEAKKRLVDAAARALSGMKGIDLQWDVNPVNLL
jgi:primosomal protein N'